VGPVVCRVASCRPPWELDATCTTASATANATALHTAPCLDDNRAAFVSPFGGAPKLGAPKGLLRAPLVGIAATPSGRGYWLVASDGGIFSFGDAQFFGSTGGTKLNRPVTSMVPDPDGTGYWLVASDGGIFAFQAPFYGSMGRIPLNRPVSAMVGGTGGYLMVGEDGGIFSFGSVPFFGSLGANPPASPIVAVAVSAGPVVAPVTTATTTVAAPTSTTTTAYTGPSTTSTKPPKPTTTTTRGSGVWYANCQEAWDQGQGNIHKGQPGYRIQLDGDHDGIACEA